KDGTLIDLKHVLLSLVESRIRSLQEVAGAEVLPDFLRGCGFQPATRTIDPSGPLSVAARREEEILAAGAIYLHGRSWPESRRLAALAFQQAEEHIEAAERVDPLPGAIETVRWLKEAGFLVVLATGDGHARAERMMAGLGILSCFDLIIGVDEVAHPKPAPDLILACAQKLGMDPCQMVGIGDTCLDAQMGRAAGMGATIGVATGAISAEELRGCCDFVIATLAELELG
ncbi:MAG: HAD family hydrolase, partial [Coprothermobacterota bacterium]|nr:HAD family hydrolase [Coprothermobacterota bacterium]